ncbi:MAG: hypothetical protein BGO39_26900 [Chloroflexi bacterium 54-19]|nr:MAG: hypothetical protein BGO39_26900 [Chloroflexi bacterium 54-19]
MFLKNKKLGAAFFIYLVLPLLTSTFSIIPQTASALAAPATATQAAGPGDSFGSTQFYQTWQRTDQPIAAQRASRSWYWGPAPVTGAIYEDYDQTAPAGKRLVQYFDKARMELTQPTTGSVSNGLLVVEMITGKLQLGDTSFMDKGPAKVPVAGDSDNAFPTYKDFGPYYNKPGNARTGDYIKAQLTPDGLNFINTYLDDPATKVATVVNNFSIPEAFWDYFNRQGVVFNQGDYTNGTISNWLFAVGNPITEAYWTKVKVGGVEKDVLVQAFERRLLTYTPSNSEEYKVEMGNVGSAYLSWRYNGKIPQFDKPIESIFTSPTHQWYVSSDTLNLRTAPNSSAPRPTNTKETPFVTQMQAGDHIQAIRAVAGEEVVKGNNVWYQIYEKPDIFVYSEYLKPLVMPDYPAVPRTHPGIWVSVSIAKQAMAVFNGDKMIYHTLVATGIEGGPIDHSTVKGVFAAIGGYRPLTQTMQGGNRASETDYKLLDIRYVTYFYADFAIHGSYWHTKYGIAEQSHGCVNATVYDASLIWQLPVGTVVDVF